MHIPNDLFQYKVYLSGQSNPHYKGKMVMTQSHLYNMDSYIIDGAGTSSPSHKQQVEE